MTAEDPLHVEFDLPSEGAGNLLDMMIAREADGDPNKWLADVIESKRLEIIASAPARLAEMIELVQSYRDIPVDPNRDIEAERAAAIAAGAIELPSGRLTRHPRPSSDWRTK